MSDDFDDANDSTDADTDAAAAGDTADPNEPSTGAAPDGDVTDGNADGAAARDRMARALGAVRREGWKAAILYAAVDAVAAFLAVNLLVAVADPGILPDRIALPAAVAEALSGALGAVSIPGSAFLAAVLGVVVFAGELRFRTRRSLVERFEAVNPPVAEALRTARDAVDDGLDSRMAARLYEDVVDRLGETSGVALVDVRRVAGTVVLIALLSLATVQVAVVDLSLFDDGPGVPGGNGVGPGEDDPRNYTGLEDGESVLGEPEDVESGDENLTARIETSGGDGPVSDGEQFPPPEDLSGGSGGGGGVQSQQAGYAQPERLEDAELIREYNLRIREET